MLSKPKFCEGGCEQLRPIWKNHLGKKYCQSCWSRSSTSSKLAATDLLTSPKPWGQAMKTPLFSRTTVSGPTWSTTAGDLAPGPLSAAEPCSRSSTASSGRKPLGSGTLSAPKKTPLFSSAPAARFSAPTGTAKTLRPVSAKLALSQRQYSQQRRVFLARPENSCCRAQLPGVGCTGTDPSYLEVHHSRGRGSYLLDESTWVPLCHFCHAKIETAPELGRSLGFIKSRLTKVPDLPAPASLSL